MSDVNQLKPNLLKVAQPVILLNLVLPPVNSVIVQMAVGLEMNVEPIAESVVVPNQPLPVDKKIILHQILVTQMVDVPELNVVP
jgi:hypothetical protein